MKKAQEHYMKITKSKKKFAMLDCWDQLKDHHKWHTLMDSVYQKKASRSTTVVSQETTNAESSTSATVVMPSRPIGTKRAKQAVGEKRKRDELIEKTSKQLEEMLSTFRYYMSENVMSFDLDTIKDPKRRAYYAKKQEQFLEQWGDMEDMEDRMTAPEPLLVEEDDDVVEEVIPVQKVDADDEDKSTC